MIKSHGIFEIYRKASIGKLSTNTLYARRSDGADWYELVKELPIGPTYAVAGGGEILGVTKDPSSLWPIGLEVIETDEPCEVFFTYVDGKLGAKLA